MRCVNCQTPLEEDMLFCPACGCRISRGEPERKSDDTAAGESALLDEAASAFDEDLRFLEARLDTMSGVDRADVADMFDNALPDFDLSDDMSPADEPELFIPAERPSVQPAGQRTARRRYGYVNLSGAADAAEPAPEPVNQAGEPPREEPPRQRSADDFGDGYLSQPAGIEGRYRRSSAGKRIASILLCLLMTPMLLYAVVNVSLRLTLTEENIRRAADGEKMLEQNILPDNRSAASFLRDLIGSDILSENGISDDILRDALRKGTLPRLFADLLIGYTDYFLYGKDSPVLNVGYITNELSAFNAELTESAGFSGDDRDWVGTDRIAGRISGGDLSFLSIDSEGGWFYRHYGVNPKLLATIGSSLVLIICGVIALLCIIMIFVINSANPPTGLCFNGVMMLVIGCLGMIAALGCLILSLIGNLWMFGELLRIAAMWTGIIGGGMFVIGLTLMIISRALKRRAARADRIVFAD